MFPDFTMRKAEIRAPKNIISLITNMIIPSTLLGMSFLGVCDSLESDELRAIDDTIGKLSDRDHDHLHDHDRLRGKLRIQPS